MSAFIVDKAHIDALVRVAGHGPFGRNLQHVWYPVSIETDVGQWDALQHPDEIGRMLWLENYRSVAYRYSDHQASGLPGPVDLTLAMVEEYRYERPTRTPNLIQTLKLLDCLEYQSSEHDGWETSAAYRFCNNLRSALTHQLSGRDEAPWEWPV